MAVCLELQLRREKWSQRTLTQPGEEHLFSCELSLWVEQTGLCGGGGGGGGGFVFAKEVLQTTYQHGGFD